MAEIGSYEADKKGRPVSAVEVRTCGGTRIYLLPVETFENHVNNVYLIDHEEHPTLFDVGTTGSHQQLEERFRELRQRFGVRTVLEDVREAVISHAHIDHFGNARTIRELGVPLAIHELDARVLAAFNERRLLASRDVGIFLAQTGLEAARADAVVEIYRSGKRHFEDLEPDRRLSKRDSVGPGWPLIHVPGHCPGMICLAVDDVVLTADHLLSRLTPVLFPQSITPLMGLDTFLRSLSRLERAGPFDLGLGGHEAPIMDLTGRIQETRRHHLIRLERVLELCDVTTVAEIATKLFGPQTGYGLLMALGESAAHAEYLHELGFVAVGNIEQVSTDYDAPLEYRAISRDASREYFERAKRSLED